MATAAAIRAQVSARQTPKQNWILGPTQDALLIIATPIGMFLAALPVLAYGGASTVLAIFVVFNVGHHLPTFLRIYGDVELFRRFKWSFLLGPLVPFTFMMAVMGYLITHGYPIVAGLYLLIILSIWDPWHFLMQHYGFMRIYDRNNAAPRALAARMDLLLAASWFVYLMLAASSWLPDLLYSLNRSTRLPLMYLFAMPGLSILEWIAWIAALTATGTYAVYLVWCARRGYYISPAKLALCVVTFGTMYLTYTPNAAIRALSPDWSIDVGFAVLGMVHVTQYLAIVWTFNRSLAKREGRARRGPFRALHARGGAGVALAYVALCLGYGWLLSHRFIGAEWLMALVISAGFTSTMMHYYFDGFIWKVRHQQNRENLAMTPSDSATAGEGARGEVSSWWDSFRDASVLKIWLKQVLYLGLPMGILTLGAFLVLDDRADDHLALEKYAIELRNVGRTEESIRQAKLAVAALDRRLAVERAMLSLRPSAAHLAQMADLIYDRSCGQHMFVEPLEGTRAESDRLRDHRREVERAVRTMEDALARNEPLSTRRREGIEGMSLLEARTKLSTWQSYLRGSRSSDR